jgi:cytochrome c-type biogenesis protein CcmF
LIAAALLHSAIVVEKREALKSWTILLAIMAFGFSLIGTFIVRSGLLTSVHAFASDPFTGTFILLILAVFMGGALTLYAFRAGAMQAQGVFSTVSRESALVLNNVLLAVGALVVFVGTLWPLVAELAFGRIMSVGPPFFDLAFTPFMVALAALLPVGSLLSWKRAKLVRHTRPFAGALVLAIGLATLAFAIQTGRSALGPIGVGLGVWVVAGVAIDLWQRSGKSGHRVRRLRRLPRADWGKSVAHAGFGITVFGIAAMLAWEQEDIRVAQVGETYQVGAYAVTLSGVDEGLQGPNYISTKAQIDLSRGGRMTTLTPEKRVYPVAGMPTTEADIRNGILRDLYVVIGDRQTNGGWTVRIYIKPFANWIWGGCIVMALGGFLSLSDRRHRVASGAAKPQRVAVG